MMRNYLALLLILLTFPFLVSADIYQWADEDGVTIYSQTPPSSGEARSIAPHKSPENREAKQKLHDMQQQAADLREDRKLEKEAKSIAKNEAQRKKDNCVAAQDNLTRLQGPGHRRYGGVRLTEEERQLKIAEAQQHIKENCNK